MSQSSWSNIALITKAEFARLEAAGEVTIDNFAKRRINWVAAQWLSPVFTKDTKPEYLDAAKRMLKASAQFKVHWDVAKDTGSARLISDLSEGVPAGQSLPEIIAAVSALEKRIEALVSAKRADGKHNQTHLRDGLLALLIAEFARAGGCLRLPSNDTTPHEVHEPLPYFVWEFAKIMQMKIQMLEKEKQIKVSGSKIIRNIHATAKRFVADVSKLREARRRAEAILNNNSFVWADGKIEAFDNALSLDDDDDEDA